MMYLLAIWLHGSATPQYLSGPNQLSLDMTKAIYLSYAECNRAASESRTLHADVVDKAQCIKRRQTTP